MSTNLSVKIYENFRVKISEKALNFPYTEILEHFAENPSRVSNIHLNHSINLISSQNRVKIWK